jgi:hypothetical protein
MVRFLAAGGQTRDGELNLSALFDEPGILGGFRAL